MAPRKKPPLAGKGGLIMAAAAVLVLALLYIDQKAPPPREPGSLPPVSEFTHLRAADVTRVELKREGSGFVLAKSGQEWVFEAPARFRADGEGVNDWLKSVLDDSTVNRDVGSKAADPARFGLDAPSTELILTGKDRKTRRLQIGTGFKNSVAEQPTIFYAREAGDNRLFMLSTSQVDAIRDKRVDELRDRTLFKIGDDTTVQRISIERDKDPLVVERRGDGWRMVKPFDAPADRIAIEGWLGGLRTARAESLLAPDASDQVKAGLDRPRLRLTVVASAGEHTLLVGNARGDDFYAARQNDPELKLISASTFRDLNKQGSDLRGRELVTLPSEKIRSIELTNSSGVIHVQREGDAWKLQGLAPGEQTKADQVQTLLNSITGPASAHVEEAPPDLAKYGLEKPVISVRVNDGAGTSQVLRLGKKGPDGSFYAMGAPNAVFRVPGYVYEDFSIKRAALVEAAEKK